MKQQTRKELEEFFQNPAVLDAAAKAAFEADHMDEHPHWHNASIRERLVYTNIARQVFNSTLNASHYIGWPESEKCTCCGEVITDTNVSEMVGDDLCRDCRYERHGG